MNCSEYVKKIKHSNKSGIGQDWFFIKYNAGVFMERG